MKPAFDPEVFRARFLLLQRGDARNDTDQARLDDLFTQHPRLDMAWQAPQELHGLYLANDRQAALEALDRFTDLYATGDLPEFHTIVDTIIAWSDQILAWHDTGQPSNGRIEGNDEQPPPSASPRRPRLHQPGQLRRPRTPSDMITTPKPTDPHLTEARRADMWSAAHDLLATAKSQRWDATTTFARKWRASNQAIVA